jgi:hypothetical protein
MIAPLHLLSLAALSFATPGAGTAVPAPLHLVTEPVAGGIRVRVVGISAVACDARFSLEVSNRSGGGTSRSVQRGVARLQPGVASTAATLTLANAGPESWSARLVVDSCGGERYEEVSGSAR